MPVKLKKPSLYSKKNKSKFKKHHVWPKTQSVCLNRMMLEEDFMGDIVYFKGIKGIVLIKLKL